MSYWWTEAELGLGANPPANNILGLSKQFKSAIPGVENYIYDNDGDVLADNEASERGVNILLVFSNDIARDQYFDLLDKIVD